MKPRVVITGIGVVAPNGIGKDAYWHALLAGKSGIKNFSRFDVTQYPSKIAGEVDDLELKKYYKKRTVWLSRFAKLALTAAHMAVEDAQLKLTDQCILDDSVEKKEVERRYQTNDNRHIGVAIGTAIGGLEIAEREVEIFHKQGVDKISPFTVMAMNPNSAVGVIALELNIKGPNLTISTGCSSGLVAIGYSYDTIRDNKADVMITGGAEAPLLQVTFDSFCRANMLTKHNDNPVKASRPFEKFRDGYVLSEGAGIVVLEKMDYALARGAHIYAELVGYEISNDCYSMVKTEPTGEEVARTMSSALEKAAFSSQEVDYINAHGSASPVTDNRETRAIKISLGKHAYNVPVSSIKSMIGQPLAAAGAIQFITSTLVVKNNWVPPTINYEFPDPECDLDYVPNKARNGKEINVALMNAFGAGGNNVSMVVRKYN